MQKQLKAMEVLCLRRMFKVPWVSRLANRKVLEKAGTRRALMKTIISRRMKFLRHVMRKEGLEHFATMGKVERKKARGRQRRFLDEMDKFMGRWRLDVLQMSREKEVWRALAANVRI